MFYFLCFTLVLTSPHLIGSQRSGRHTPSGSHLRKSHESFSIQADKKEKTRHNHFIKTAQPYKPKVTSTCLPLYHGFLTFPSSLEFRNVLFIPLLSNWQCWLMEAKWTWILLTNTPMSVYLLAGIVDWAGQEEEQGGHCGHWWSRDSALPLPLQRAAGVGRADEAAEDGSLLLAAWWGVHGQGPGGLQAVPLHGLWGQAEWRGWRHFRRTKGLFQVSGWPWERNQTTLIWSFRKLKGKGIGICLSWLWFWRWSNWE